MIRKPRMPRALRAILFLVVLMTLARLPAQTTTAGALTGTITDTSGAAIPATAIHVVSQNTGTAYDVKATAKGFYTVENLPGGDYTLTATVGGFSSVTVKDIHLDPGQRRGQDVHLSVGSVDTKVDVQADAISVQTESAESGGTISAKEVANLMLNGRNFQQLATLVPGVSSSFGTNSQVNAGYLGQTNLIVGGQSSEETTYTIDGVYNMTPTSLININITPSIDAINELRVLKNAYSAKYGYAGSGQILIETKSGTKLFHGSGFEYVRNNSIGVARPYSISGSPVTSSSLHYNIFGFSFGGPVALPHVYNPPDRFKTFFFTGAEFKINHYASLLNSRSELTAAQRLGDLSSSFPGLGPIGAKVLTCDSYCQSLLAARGLSQATCFGKNSAGIQNQINPTCFDPAAAYFINPANNFLPLPNLPQYNSTNFANYINTNPERDSQNDTDYRIDQQLGNKNLVTLRYLHEEVNDIRPARNYNDPAPNPGAIAYTPALNAMVRWNYTVNPSLINAAAIAYTDQKVQLLPTGNYNIPQGLFTQAFANNDNRLPAVNIGSFYSWLGVGAQPNFSKTGDGIFSDDATLSRGRHTIQFGGLYLWNILRLNSSAFSQGSFTFSGTHTNDVAGDFLLGLLSSYTQSNVQRTGVFHQHEYELYAQDDWKTTPRLVLSYGLRYSFYAPATAEGNSISNFTPSTFSTANAPVVSLTGGLTYNTAGQPLTATGTVASLFTNGVSVACQGIPCGITTPKKGLFSPRVGFAYRLNNAGTLSLHGGYGIGYTQVGLFQTSNLLSNNPFVSTSTFTNSQFSKPAGGTAGLPGLQTLSAVDGTYRPAMLQSYSLTLEAQVVPKGILTLAYAGDKADHIFSNAVDRNFAQNGTSTYSAACAASTNNPNPVPAGTTLYDPCINGANAAVPGATQVSQNYYRPYLGYSAISTGVSIGGSNYNGLQTGFIYRLATLQLNAAYTYSKALGNQNQTNTGSTAYGFDSNIGFQNPRNPGADYGRPNYDRTHVFTSAYVYETPFFKKSSHFLLRELASGFGTSGLITVQSGFATTVGLSSPYAGLANRPNQVGTLVRNPGSGKKALGQAPLYSFQSFAAPGFGSFGNSEPGVLRGPKEVSFATAINKTFPVTERVGLQVRAEAFNVFNHPNINSINATYIYYNPNTTAASASSNASSFGYATGAGDPRQMEFSARVTF